MNTSEMNTRSSSTRRQRRAQAPRVECLESRELLTYPFASVAFLANQALFHHQNTAFQAINVVNSSLRTDLNTGALATLKAGPVTTATATTFVNTVTGVVTTYQIDANAQLLPRFPFVDTQIVTNAQNILNGVNTQNALFQNHLIDGTTFEQNVTIIINGGIPPAPVAPTATNATLNAQATALITDLAGIATLVGNGTLTLAQVPPLYNGLTGTFRTTVVNTPNLRAGTLAGYDAAVTALSNAVATELAKPAPPETPAMQQAALLAAVGSPTAPDTTPNTFASTLIGTGGLFV